MVLSPEVCLSPPSRGGSGRDKIHSCGFRSRRSRAGSSPPPYILTASISFPQRRWGKGFSVEGQGQGTIISPRRQSCASDSRSNSSTRTRSSRRAFEFVAFLQASSRASQQDIGTGPRPPSDNGRVLSGTLAKIAGSKTRKTPKGSRDDPRRRDPRSERYPRKDA